MSADHVAARLRTALDVLADAKVPSDLRAEALSLVYADLRPSSHGPQPPSAATSRPRPDDSDLAGRLGVSPEALERVFDIDSEGVHLVISRTQLDRSKASAMREVAQLVIAARQKLGLEEWTPLEIVRDQCDARGVLDASNFSTEVRKLDGEGLRFRGGPRNREAKMNSIGFEQVSVLIRRLAGGDASSSNSG